MIAPQKIKFLFFLCFIVFINKMAFSAIHVQATRIVYEESASAAALPISNESDSAYMIQSWLNSNDSYESTEKLPFIITPPLVILNPSEDAILRIIYSGKGLPTDKESLFWINVQEIPPNIQDDTSLQIAIRTRIKLFYRPSGLKTDLETASKEVQWSIKENTLNIKNRSKLHITFSQVAGREIGSRNKEIDLDMLAPGEEANIPLDQLNLSQDSKNISFSYINDYGGLSNVLDAKLFNSD